MRISGGPFLSYRIFPTRWICLQLYLRRNRRTFMQIAVLTFDGFNEIDSFVAAHILNRLRPQGRRAFITSPDAVITSANEVVVHAERPVEFAAEADAVIIGSGLKTSEIAENRELLGRIRLDPT